MPLVQSKAVSPAAAGLGGPLRPQCGPFVADTVVGRCYSDLAPPPDTHGRSGQGAPAEDKSLSRMVKFIYDMQFSNPLSYLSDLQFSV